MTEKQLRILTYVLLGMTLGVSIMLVALFIDVHTSSKQLPSEKKEATKENSDES